MSDDEWTRSGIYDGRSESPDADTQRAFDTLDGGQIGDAGAGAGDDGAGAGDVRARVEQSETERGEGRLPNSGGSGAAIANTASDGTDAINASATIDGRVHRRPRGRRWAIVTGVGVLALVGAVLLVAVPNLGRPLDPAVAQRLRTLVLVVAGFVGAVGASLAYLRDRPAATRTEIPPPSPDESFEATTDADLNGVLLDETLAVLDGESDAGSAATISRQQSIRSDLFDLAVRVVASTDGCSIGEARRRVNTGVWTDDVRAAAFLTNGPPDRPLSMRLRDWASGEAYRRQVTATVGALADRMGVADS